MYEWYANGRPSKYKKFAKKRRIKIKPTDHIQFQIKITTLITDWMINKLRITDQFFSNPMK